MGPKERFSDIMACPSQEQLLAFWLGQAGWENLDAVATHLSRCSRCKAQLRELGPTPDTFVAGLRAGARLGPMTGEPECQRLERCARAIPMNIPPTGRAPSRFEFGPEAGSLPEVLGQYRLLEQLGRGGMGAVFKAEHARLKRLVAIKLLPEEHMGHAQAVARFQREMEAVGKLDHPNVIRATDAGEADGRHFLVMEYCQGLDLGRLGQRLGPLPVADACELVRQAALGLQYVHEHGLVHRDIKPSNLLLTPEGQVKVLDLGLARLREEALPGAELTSRGQAMGTADYMAPEQGIDAHRVDIRADIYSLGCTLYKLLAGQAPFAGADYASTVKKFQAHALVPPPPLCDKAPTVPPELAAVVERMLAKSPGERYATPAAVAAALVPFSAGADLPGLLQGVQPAAGIALPAILDAAVQACASAETKERDALTSEPQKRQFLRKRPRLVLTGLVASILVVLGVAAIVHRQPQGKPSQPIVVPLVWQDLLAQPPRELAWPRATGQSPWFWESRQLTVTCGKSGLLRLGETAAPGFKIEVGLLQPRWEGGVGVFFGFRDAQDLKGNPIKKFQMVYLLGSEESKFPYHLERFDCTLTPLPSGGYDIGKFSFISQTIPKPMPHEQRLELTVESGKLTSVLWGGMNIADLVKESHNARFKPEDYQGEFGTYHMLSTCSIPTARFMLFERSKP